MLQSRKEPGTFAARSLAQNVWLKAFAPRRSAHIEGRPRRRRRNRSSELAAIAKRHKMAAKLVAHITQDLMAAAHVRKWAADQGATYRMISDFEQLKHLPPDVDIMLLAVDLQWVERANFMWKDWLADRRRAGQHIRVISYAQHVQEAQLAEAAREHIGEVMTRGQFFRWLIAPKPPEAAAFTLGEDT